MSTTDQSTSSWTFGEALRAGFDAYRRHWRVLVAAVAITEIVGFGENNLINFFLEPTDFTPKFSFFRLVGFPVLNITVGIAVEAFFTIGLVRIALAAVRGEAPSLRWLFASGGRYMRMFLFEMLWAAFSFVGFLFCVIPGVYLGTALCLGRFFIVETQLAPVACARKSIDALRGRLTLMLGFLLLTGAICGAGMVPGAIHAFHQIYMHRQAGAHLHHMSQSEGFFTMQLPGLLTIVPLYPIMLCALAFIYTRASPSVLAISAEIPEAPAVAPPAQASLSPSK